MSLGYTQDLGAGICEDGPALQASAGPHDPTKVLTGSCPCQPLSSAGPPKDTPTNGMAGPLFNASSPSAALQWSLESRYRPRMPRQWLADGALAWSPLANMNCGAVDQRKDCGRPTANVRANYGLADRHNVPNGGFAN